MIVARSSLPGRLTLIVDQSLMDAVMATHRNTQRDGSDTFIIPTTSRRPPCSGRSCVHLTIMHPSTHLVWTKINDVRWCTFLVPETCNQKLSPNTAVFYSVKVSGTRKKLAQESMTWEICAISGTRFWYRILECVTSPLNYGRPI